MNLKIEGLANQTVIKTDLTKKLSIDNHPKTYEVYKIRLDQLYYNDQNDRIATWISQYKNENGIDKFDKGKLGDQSYNEIIKGFITESNPEALKLTQRNMELIGQQESGVVLLDGRIIDGNRRYTCLKNIEQKTGKTQYFDAVFLEHDITTNAKQIKMLELLLQHGVDKPVDYNPIDRLVGVYNDIIENGLLTIKEYANSVNQSEKEIQRELEKASLMIDYLEFINAPKQYHLARTMNLNDPLKELAAIMRQSKDADKGEDLKNVVFTNFLMQPFGDMTRYIRRIKKIALNANLLDEYLNEQMNLTVAVCDLIESKPVITQKVINEEIRSNTEIQDALEHSTDKWVSKADSDASRNKPAQQVEKAFEILDTIDTNIFIKLSESQREVISQKIMVVQELLDEIRGKLDV